MTNDYALGTREHAESITTGRHPGVRDAHRRALTAALTEALPAACWRSRRHHPEDDPMFEGYFIIGFTLPTGPVTYHYRLSYWDDFSHVAELEHAPKWDGATPGDSVVRLLAWARSEG